jgi:hypothetical protein
VPASPSPTSYSYRGDPRTARGGACRPSQRCELQPVETARYTFNPNEFVLSKTEMSLNVTVIGGLHAGWNVAVSVSV